MKTLLIFSFLLLSVKGQSQEKNIETESVTLDNLITFIVENYSVDDDTTATKNITFLIETYGEQFNTEDKVILKQAFKLFSKRVSENDRVSIVSYSNMNGIALKQAEGIDIKKMLYVIEHPKQSIKTIEKDGIELAYEFTKENFVEEAENSVVMVRIPNRSSEPVTTTNVQNTKTKKKSNSVVLTAIALLPEIIAVIKN
ncbi:vWA domain-containing protein [Winogradskyella ursingii]|uniref:hypothetical protein n=1 Tax=Winogradskyella ursingii TaxID=2686079 RepID=UPI0015C7F246|nr:hypothetical protein [Winogradskyella ursingii]